MSTAQKVQQHPVFIQAQDKASYYASQLDKELSKYPVLNNLEQRTQVPKSYAVIGGLLLLVFLHSFNAFAAPVSNLVGWGIPAYLSFKAIESPSPHDDVQWLTYWVVFGFFNFLESFALRVVLYYVPWYFAIKSVAILWLQLPAFRGAQTTYFAVIKPVLANETHWDINTTSASASAIGSSIASTSVSELETSTGSITLEDGSVGPVDRLPETFEKHFCIMDLTIEFPSGEQLDLAPKLLQATLFSINTKDTFSFEKVSLTLWKYIGPDPITLSVSVTELVILIQSDIGVVGFVWFSEADFDKVKFSGSTQLINGALVLSQDFPKIKLSFAISYQEDASKTHQGADRSDPHHSLSTCDHERRANMEKIPQDTTLKIDMLFACGQLFFERFGNTNDGEDLDNCILVYDLLGRLIPHEDARYRIYLTRTFSTHVKRFEEKPTPIDVDSAISIAQRAISSIPEGDVGFASQLHQLGQLLLRNVQNGADLSQAIIAYQHAIQLCPKGDDTVIGLLNNLAVSLVHRFQRGGDPADLSDAIVSLQQAVQITADTNAFLPILLNTLQSLFSQRFSLTRDLSDLSHAISTIQRIIQLVPEGHGALPSFFNSLGNMSRLRFKSTGDVGDLSNAIFSFRSAARLSSEGHASLLGILTSLGALLLLRSELTKDPADASDAILSFQRSLQFISEDHLQFPALLNNLGGSYLRRFECTGDLTDVSEAISVLQRAIQRTPEGDSGLSGRLNNLGNSLFSRFQRTENLVDITDAISALRRAVQLTPESSQLLCDLGKSLVARFQFTKELSDVSDAIPLLERGIHLTPEGHPDLPARLNDYGLARQYRFNCTGDASDILDSIATIQRSIELIPEGHPDLYSHLYNLGNSFLSRFNHNNNPGQDLSEAISLLRRAVQLAPSGHPKLPRFLTTYGNSLFSRYKRTSDVSDISSAIESLQLAIRLGPGDAELSVRLYTLGLFFLHRFDATEDLLDISNAILFMRDAIQHSAGDHADLPFWLNRLGFSLRCRFDKAGDPTDISDALSAHRRAIQLTPEGHVALPAMLNDLGHSLFIHFERFGNLDDISEAISLVQRAVQLAPDSKTGLASWLTTLGISLRSRFEYSGDTTDISDSISSLLRATQLTPEGHTLLPARLNNLGSSYLRRFSRNDDLADLSNSMLSIRRAIELTPESHSNLPLWLNNLAGALIWRFKRTGDLAHLSESVSSLRHAIQLTPEGSMGLPSLFNTLGDSLHIRFVHTGDAVDLSDALSASRRSVELTPEGHAGLPGRLNNLAATLISHFSRTGDPAEMSDTILMLREAIRLTPDDHVNLPFLFNTLGDLLRVRSFHTEDSADISDSLLSFHRAVQLTPEGHANLPAFLNNHGTAFLRQYQSTGDLADISEAISSFNQAFHLTPAGHAVLPGILNNLGNSFLSRFKRANDIADVLEAISHYRQAATQTSGRPSMRLDSAKSWAQLCQLHHPSQVLEAYTVVIDLISQVAGMEQTVEIRHKNLGKTSNLASEAAAIALSNDRVDLALEWLEQGRCLVWNQIHQLRTPLDALRAKHPDLADRLQSISQALERAGSRQVSIPETESNMVVKAALDNDANEHIKLANEWNQLLGEIRSISGFADFLRPRKTSHILAGIPSEGPVIIFNMHEKRCDALALVKNSLRPIHIPLKHFHLKHAKELQQQMTSCLASHGLRFRDVERGVRRVQNTQLQQIIQSVLVRLWNGVVEPIFNRLDYKHPKRTLSRIWWCPTGPLTFLPIHAAGIYHPGGSETTSDFVVSSYTPTVTTLTDKADQIMESGANHLLLVSQVDAPGLSRIPGADIETRELSNFMEQAGINSLRLAGTNATTTEVIKQLALHSSVHLACHGMQDGEAPLRSGFYLGDRRLELSEIMKYRLPNADLAFLSACQTSTGDEKLSEEAVHLAAGMLAVGYRSVVATMWSIQDSAGPEVSREFYRHLLQKGKSEGQSTRLDGARAAFALHYATQRLRDRGFLAWVPYVHFGV